MTDLVIETLDLSKKYKKSDSFSLENLNIKVKAGEVYGYLGPNGAGKSTTIRLIMDFIRPNSGKSLVLGIDSREKILHEPDVILVIYQEISLAIPKVGVEIF